MTEIIKLPAELDNERVIFSYGSLLDHEKLRELLRAKGEFNILETGDLAEAARLAKDNPQDIVILRNVRLENVRVSIVTEAILRRWYQDRGGDPQKIIDADEILEAAYLYARPARSGERGRTLNGGLICNLSSTDVATLDNYELIPVLQKTRTPELKIEDRTFFPEHIFFYAGTESVNNLTREERAERARLLNLNRKPGELGPHAKWPKNVRHTI